MARREWHNGVEAHWEQGAAGATRFSEGLGRAGDFARI
jgi:enoyl-CoA hydratase